MTRNQLLVSFIVGAVLVGGLALRMPLPAGQMLLAIFGWSLAYFGSEMASLIGMRSSLSSDRYVDPFVRGLGWLFVVVVLALFVARVMQKS